MSLSIHQDFVDPDPAARQKDIDHTMHCMQLAHEMGIPCLRLNTGRWSTTESFDDLMKNRGIEPVLPGHTEDEGFKWCIDSIEKVLPKAEEYGVLLALENHWGLARTPEGLAAHPRRHQIALARRADGHRQLPRGSLSRSSR